MSEKLTPFDFIKAVSQTKVDIISDDIQPEEIEKQYEPYMTNRAFSLYEDTILHSNEMNRLPHLFKDAQFTYYLGALKSRSRFSKWPKLTKNVDLDNIQQTYQCNRTVAKSFLKLLTLENLKEINNSRETGG